MAAIEEAAFEAKERRKQMYVIQINGSEMIITKDAHVHGGRVMYRTGVRR